MADAMDLVQQRVEEERQRHICAARAKTPGVSRVLCLKSGSWVIRTASATMLSALRLVTRRP